MRTSLVIALALFVSCRTALAVDYRERGFAAMAYSQAHLRLPGGLFAQQFVPGKKTAGNAACWGTGVQLSALNATAAIDSSKTIVARTYALALDAYRFQRPGEPIGYQPYPGNKPGEMFYDDNAWLVLAFFDTYQLTKDDKFLQRSKDAFAFVASGESDALGGGIYWSDKKTGKNTCVNAPAICGALALYGETHDAKYLACAERWYAWVAKLQDADGLYWDNIAPDGNINKTKWSYNTALMIRANVMLAHAKSDAKYLDEANRLADAAEKHWFREDDTLADDGAFGHLLCEALLMLDQTKPRPSAVAKVRGALDQLAKIGRSNSYPKRWDGWGNNETTIELLHEASAARAFLFAAKYLEAPATRPAR